MIEQTMRFGMKDKFNGTMESFCICIPKERKTALQNAQQSINQKAVCEACKGGCGSHQAEGVPVGMNSHSSSGEIK